MDTRLTPLVAQEMARPYAAFAEFALPPGVQGLRADVAGSRWPLLSQPSEYVLLNFEIHPDGTWRSPQVPEPAQWQNAAANGTTIAGIQASTERLNELRGGVNYRALIERLPEGTVPAAVVPNAAVAQTDDSQESQSQAQQSVELGLQYLSANNDLVRRQRSFDVEQSEGIRSATCQFRRAGAKPGRRRRRRPRPVDWRSVGARPSDRRRPDDRTRLLARLAKARSGPAGGSRRRSAGFPVRRVNGSPGAGFEARARHAAAGANRTAKRAGCQSRVDAAALGACAGLGRTGGMAALAIALLLLGVVALDARREAFVSAVTHELRTPLTTFRMYAGMLEDGMVTGEGDRKSYLHTPRVEAERLSHLVENVLAYARLERGPRASARERFSVGNLLERMQARLSPARARPACN